ncbi:MAG: hypothetical protein IJZ31_10880 [Bacteroidaceae bacterium]|nr:hypothetical protein [Bacteroidaceae bacterium]
MSYAQLYKSYDPTASLQARAEALIAMHTALYLQGGFSSESDEEQCLALTMALVDPYLASYDSATSDPALHHTIVELMRVASYGYHLPTDDPWYPFIND